jgi:hypothetical protein
MWIYKVLNISKNVGLSLFLITSLTYCVFSSSSKERIEVVSKCSFNFDVDTHSSKVKKTSILLPKLLPVEDVYVAHKKGQNLKVQLLLENTSELNGYLHWTKDYGPDEVCVDPLSGLVTWDIENDMPSESFHIGIKAMSTIGSASLSFIVHAGVNQVVTVGTNGDYPTIKSGMSELNSGGSLVVLDGTYTGEDNYIGRVNSGNLQHPPSGTEDAYTTIMSKHPGKVTLMDGAMVSLKGLPGVKPVSYAAIKGLFVIDGQIGAHGYPEDLNARHHHIKFIRNGAQGGSGKAEPFNTSYSDNILFENNYAFGGGRYKFTSYLASNIVWRRNVARYDHGPVPDEPKGTYSVYSSMDAFLSNNIAVDGDQPEFLDSGEIAGEFATPTTAGPTRARFQRNIQLNSAMMFTNLSKINGDSDVELSHMVSWDVRPDNNYVKSFASGWLDHITMGEISSRNATETFVHGWGGNFRGITNSILHDFENGDMFSSVSNSNGEEHETVDGRMVERYGADTLNISSFNGALNAYDSDITNITHFNPIQSESNPNGSLRYITRIETGSNLSNLDKNGSELGATVLTFVGKSGTYFGESGFDEETYIPMWPFPMESIIKEKMAAYSYTGNTYSGGEHTRVESGTGSINGARGYAVEGQTLSNYVWGYLGSVVPPMNVTAISSSESVLIQWQAGPEVSRNEITGYKVYKLDLSNGDKELFKTLPEDSFMAEISNLETKTEYAFGITSVVNERESAIAYPVLVTTE